MLIEVRSPGFVQRVGDFDSQNFSFDNDTDLLIQPKTPHKTNNTYETTIAQGSILPNIAILNVLKFKLKSLNFLARIKCDSHNLCRSQRKSQQESIR